MIQINERSFSPRVLRRELVFPMSFVGLLATLIGCSAFKSQKRVDLAPFAENMITLAADIQYGLGQDNPVYLRNFANGPKVLEAKVYASKVRAVIRGIIAYSLELVSLADSKMSGKERAVALADYLDGLLRPVLSSPQPELNLTVADLDTILTDVRDQKTLIDALNAAQPIVNEVARASGETLAEAKDALDEAVAEIQTRIEEDNWNFTRAYRDLRNAQVATMQNIVYLGNYRMGDTAALDTLFAREPSLREVVESTTRITPEDMRAIEDRLLFKLRALSELRTQLKPDMELYWQQNRELDEITEEFNGALRKARVAIIAWSRGHQRLAAGVTEPAKIDLLGIARKAAGQASPVPLP